MMRAMPAGSREGPISFRMAMVTHPQNLRIARIRTVWDYIGTMTAQVLNAV